MKRWPKDKITLRNRARVMARSWGMRLFSALARRSLHRSSVGYPYSLRCAGSRSGLVTLREFNDAAVNGVDHIEMRPGLAAMLTYIASNGARTIIVETASHFALLDSAALSVALIAEAACLLVSSLLLARATMSQRSSLTNQPILSDKR